MHILHTDMGRLAYPGWVTLRCPHEALSILSLDNKPINYHPPGVVVKVEWHRGQLFPRVGFIVTNLFREFAC